MYSIFSLSTESDIDACITIIFSKNSNNKNIRFLIFQKIIIFIKTLLRVRESWAFDASLKDLH
jgi:hypothetical protein